MRPPNYNFNGIYQRALTEKSLGDEGVFIASYGRALSSRQKKSGSPFQVPDSIPCQVTENITPS